MVLPHGAVVGLQCVIMIFPNHTHVLVLLSAVRAFCSSIGRCVYVYLLVGFVGDLHFVIQSECGYSLEALTIWFC